NTTDDRAQIQTELDQLTDEIDRISDTTEFNTQNLLDGSFAATLQVGANDGQTISFSISAMDSAGLTVTAISVGTNAQASGSISLLDD
ncbi:flagellin N-terminal helical domain-containing protein, partial [Bacillus sp. Au-Bac7]|uniref:flagellin N-terminal helical domain-containing protein n=1 Tax=Bacillus sp. Au-Bac7 TaxID=2906458 RepID=UPI003FA3B22E|nr:flagellin [Bacillus sp. Au-Bac7]